jgi:hypothetical protein
VDIVAAFVTARFLNVGVIADRPEKRIALLVNTGFFPKKELLLGIPDFGKSSNKRLCENNYGIIIY